jgi:hypothetical protein
MTLGVFRTGDLVWFRGKFAKQYSVRGVVECVSQRDDTLEGVTYGVRLENGNFSSCDWTQVKARSK